jgi:signal transduction histidine kinase
VAREAVEDARRQYPDAKRFVLETMVVNSLRVYTNRLYMFRVLRELLYNSAKYSTGEVVTLYVQERARTVVFIVEDEGPGIPEQYQKVLFDQFSKRDDFSEGLGLGLPLTKRHAQRLGGDLTLDEDYHDGCRFIVELPLV